MTAERSNRTFICSVLFLDIVEYSRKPVAEQIQLKDQFNALIADAIRDIAAADRIILDTGDGVAVNFLGDPEDALFVAMCLRDAFAPDPDAPPRFPARIGVNLGPVRLVKDLNGQPNIIGDGINVAQRIMGFAKPGQILVSRSYFEVVSHISEGYGQLFRYEGSRTDKHVREHEVYSIGYGGAPAGISPAERAEASTREQAMQSATANIASGALMSRFELWLNNRSVAYGTATLSVGAFATALLLNFLSVPAQSERHVTALPAAAHKANNTIAQLTEAREQIPLAKPQPVKRKLSFPWTKRKPATAPPSEPAPDEAASNEAAPAAVETGGSGTIALAISPWGEVYVDGDPVGVSPPVNEVQVAAGTRRIEVRNGSFPAYTEVIEVKADQKVRIKHKFN